ncbi:MAG TPA: hypothetical protein DD658_04065 [Deltaproteobacteria bacterium]|nr:MAG: hypothetical protein A2X88_00505 [Deltaproteobacteria bacterium GWC2_65_14]HBO69350.1 hypothetical protein [Deltaproteobacteria bacterium]
MTRRFLLAAAALLLLLSSCKEERARPDLSPADEALLTEKADGKIGVIIRENLPSLFAGLVVFRSDVFLSQSAMLDERGLSVLNAFGKAAIVLLNSPDIPLLLKEDAVKKVYYLCRQGPLARFHPAFEMELLRRFGEGKEQEPVSFLIRFRDAPDGKDEAAVTGAGFHVDVKTGPVWGITGPPTSLPRLLENDRILFYEGASKARTM